MFFIQVLEAHARIVEAHPFRNLKLRDLFPSAPKFCPCFFGEGCFCVKQRDNTEIEKELKQGDAEDEDLVGYEKIEHEFLENLLKKYGVEFTGKPPSEKLDDKLANEANDL